jgi:hypothetical protein
MILPIKEAQVKAVTTGEVTTVRRLFRERNERDEYLWSTGVSIGFEDKLAKVRLDAGRVDVRRSGMSGIAGSISMVYN